MQSLIPKIISYQLYLLQLENYEIGRYWRLLVKKGFFPAAAQRKNLVWTAKARALFLMSVALHILLVSGVGLAAIYRSFGLADAVVAAAAIAVLPLPFYAIFFTAALLILGPFDWWAKRSLVKRAKKKLSACPELTVIGIAGSYGKTTMKEALGRVLGHKLTVAVAPDSVNTPVGIARFILRQVNPATRVMVLELGEHYLGDVADLCRIAPPQVVVVTGINQAHLERLASLQHTESAVFEAVANAKPNALVLLNGDDQRVVGSYARHLLPGQVAKFYRAGDLSQAVFDPVSLSWTAESPKGRKLTVRLLGHYSLGVAAAVMIAAESFGLSETETITALAGLRPVPHRLEPIRSSAGVLVIDDSYNGNPDGVREAAAVLASFSGRRRIFLTPGLVETGPQAVELHREIGVRLASCADLVILIRNSVTPYIAQGIKTVAGKLPEVMWFDTAPQAHASLKDILRSGDVILFQNDWGDQYV